MTANKERKYFVKGSWIFNLEAMHDKLWNIENDLFNKEINFPITICGKTINDFDDMVEEEKFSLGYENQPYFDDESFGNNLLQSDSYYELESGRIVYYSY